VSRCVMDSACSLRSVAVWPSCTMSIQFAFMSVFD
jgi:hypothetical protein